MGKLDTIQTRTRYKPGHDDWNRKYVITFFRDTRNSEDNDLWIFGGCFRVIKLLENYKEQYNHKYIIQLLYHSSHDLIGRLVVRYHNTSQQIRRIAEECINDIEFSEELEKPIQKYDLYKEESERMKEQTEELISLIIN